VVIHAAQPTAVNMKRKLIIRIVISLVIFAGLDLGSGLFLIPDSMNAFRTRHYYYHHGLLPNQANMTAWGALFYPVKTNSLGLIDSAVYRVELQGDRHRILVLGDSHSEGVGVPYPLTFAGRLSESLKSEGVEILNASAVSYSQKIEYLKARHLIEQKELEVDEILVLIDFSDIQNELVYKDFEPTEKGALGDLAFRLGNRLKNASTLYYLADGIRTEKQQQAFFESIGEFYEDARDRPDRNIWELYSGFFSHFDDETLLSNPRFHGMGGWLEDESFRDLALEGISSGQQYLLRLKQLCDEHGIKLTLSVHPWHLQIRNGTAEDEYVRRWKAFADEHGISFLNLYPLFINEEDPEMVIRKYYIANDNHWNEFGHQKVAAFLEGYFTGNAGGAE
jgi:hypothetical protein